MLISQVLEEKKILIKGLEANYKVSGQGPAFFILHGWGGSSDSWINVQKVLAGEKFQVIIPDFPGFGKSLTPKEPWEVNNYVEWLKSFIEQMKVKTPFFLLGHSFGGRIAIKFAARYPENIKALILCSSAGIKSKKSFKNKMFYYLGRIGEYLFSQKPLLKFKNGARNTFYQIIRQRDYLQAKGVMKETVKKVLAEDLMGYLSQIKAETLILWGENDRMVPIKYGYIMAKEISKAKMITFPKIGHSPHLEIPDKLAKEILLFIKS